MLLQYSDAVTQTENKEGSERQSRELLHPKVSFSAV